MNAATSPLASPLVNMCSYDQIGYLPDSIVSALGATPSTATIDTPPPVTPLSATYETVPGVCLITETTVPVASSTRPPSESGTAPMIVFTNTARVPELRGRFTTTTFWSAPPASFQFTILPANMSRSCCFVSPFTPAEGLVTTAKPTTATRWSTSSGCVGAVMSESPTSIALAATWLIPVDEPPPDTLILTFLCAS